MNQEQPEYEVSRRGIYLLPNLLTTAALFAGFYAIIAAMKLHFDTAAIAIYVAMLADGFDGRVARITNTQSAFGAQYDSLADMVSFGVAPAVVVYSWSLFYLGKLGWLAAFFYIAATALRLARFNSQAVDKSYFQGLSSTSSAGVMAGLIWLGTNYDIYAPAFSLPIAVFTMLIGALMVSTIRYYSFKSIDFKGKVSFFTVVLVVLLISAVAYEPAGVLFGVFLLYALSGPVITLWQLRQMRHRKIDKRIIKK